MRKRLTIFVLVAGLVAGALGGVPTHAGAHDCPMKGMAEDCCATARGHDGAMEVSAARLCCALNCTEPGTTAPAGTLRLSPTVALTLHSGAVPPAVTASPQLLLPRSASESPPDSHPAYIRHLALLI